MPAVHGRDVVEADGRTRRRGDRIDQRPRVGAVGAEIHQPSHAQREKAPVARERQLAGQIRRAPVMIAGNGLRTGPGPFHRPSRLLGGQHQRQEFRVDLVPHAEAAADIDRADAEALRAKAGDVRKRGFDIRCPLAWQAQLVRFTGRVVDGDAGLRLHRVAGNPLRVQVDPHDMRRVGKSLLGAPPIAVFIVERQVVGHVLVQRDGAVGDGLAGLDHDRQVFVFDLDELGRVLGEGVSNSATIRATGSPTKRTRPCASAARNGTRSELPPTPLKKAVEGVPFQPAATASAAVTMSRTPGSRRAASVLIRRIFACARSARRK